MNKEQELRLKLAILQGEFIGTLKAITWWDIPNELKDILEKRIVELEEKGGDDDDNDEHNTSEEE